MGFNSAFKGLNTCTDEICVPLGYYARYSVNSVRMFRQKSANGRHPAYIILLISFICVRYCRIGRQTDTAKITST